MSLGFRSLTKGRDLRRTSLRKIKGKTRQFQIQGSRSKQSENRLTGEVRVLLDPRLTEPQSWVPLKELSRRTRSSATLSPSNPRSETVTHSSNQTLGVLVNRSLLGEDEIVVEDSGVHIGVVRSVEGSLGKNEGGKVSSGEKLNADRRNDSRFRSTSRTA